jgi:phosphohistidine phosphatase
MTYTIILVRHGESADKQRSQSDFDRLLTQQGNDSIERLGSFLIKEKLLPKNILSSDAARTTQTTEALLRTLTTAKPQITYEHELYHGNDEVYLNSILQLHPPADVIMVVGHNPSISSLIGLMTGDYTRALHPGQAALIQFDKAIGERSGRLMKLIGPFLK